MGKKDNLILDVSPTLLEAMGIPGEEKRVDYFRLLGLNPATCDAAAVEKAVLDRSKTLRQWQNSPQHGEEAVNLLPMLHRVAAILRNPKRREAYREELESLRSGARKDPRVEFEKMVRAAMADGQIDRASKGELLRFATESGLTQDEAGRILSQISAATSRAPIAPEQSWQFRIQGEQEGPEAFRIAAQILVEGGGATREEIQTLFAEAPRFKVGREAAEAIFRSIALDWFKQLVRGVARDGVLNDNQAKLLVPKALNLGIGVDQAYEAISEYTFTSASREDITSLNLAASSFDDSDIDSFLGKQSAVLVKKRSPLPKQIALGALALGGVGGLLFLMGNLGGALFGGASGPSSTSPTTVSGAGGTASGAFVPSTPAPPTPTPAPVRDPARPWLAPLPDPPSGLLTVRPVEPGDPPAFQVKIVEVTCKEYQEFLYDSFYPDRPEGWGLDSSFPPGWDRFPVTGIARKDAEAFCEWKAKKLGLAPGSVRLPTPDEWKRLVREPMPKGNTIAMNNFWRATGLAGLKKLSPAQSAREIDQVFLPDGQVYDLMTNAAEWGAGEEDGKAVLLGGDVELEATIFDPRRPRHIDPAKRDPFVGFRYVVSVP